MFFKLRGDAKAVGDHEFLDLKAFNTRIVGDGIKSAHIANNDVVRGRPALSKYKLKKVVVEKYTLYNLYYD